MMDKLILQRRLSVAAFVCLFSTGIMAQQKNNEDQQAPITNSSNDKTMDDSAIDKATLGEMSSMEGMDHSKMPNKSNTTESDARDPHAYSNGLTLDSGAFALPGLRKLKMADEHSFGTVLFNRFEYADGQSNNSGDVAQFDMQAWYGSSYDQLVVKSEGQVANNKLLESESQILWGHAISTFWDLQTGLKFDSSEGPSRQWAIIGLQGLAPYWFEVNSSLAIDRDGRSALSIEVEYELLLSQRLILQPRVLVSAYGKDDAEIGVGKGLSSVTAGIRMRYEISRQFAPYVGIEWTGQYGNTADFRKLEGNSSTETQWVAGIRFWFQ